MTVQQTTAMEKAANSTCSGFTMSRGSVPLGGLGMVRVCGCHWMQPVYTTEQYGPVPAPRHKHSLLGEWQRQQGIARRERAAEAGGDAR